MFSEGEKMSHFWYVGFHRVWNKQLVINNLVSKIRRTRLTKLPWNKTGIPLDWNVQQNDTMVHIVFILRVKQPIIRPPANFQNSSKISKSNSQEMWAYFFRAYFFSQYPLCYNGKAKILWHLWRWFEEKVVENVSIVLNS